MNTHADKTQENRNQTVANEISQKKSGGESTFQFVDNRHEAVIQKRLQEMVNNSPQAKKVAQLQAMADNYSAQQQQPIQLICKKAGLSEENYRSKLRSTVILYAEIEGKPVGTDGVFKTSGSNHAEDNLIAKLKESNISTGNLNIWLSTSPCSSVFGTRKDDCSEGCQEILEKLHTPPTFNVKVLADHLYQPKDLATVERAEDFKTGFSSASVAHTSKFPMSVHKQPAWTEGSLSSTKENVAQLKALQGMANKSPRVERTNNLLDNKPSTNKKIKLAYLIN